MTILASNDAALVCPKQLAYILDDSDAAIFLQQIHYYLEHKSGKVIDGVRWIYNTYSQWLTEIPHLTEWRLRTIVKLLKSHGVLLVERHDRSRYNQRCWYTIDYKSLEALLGSRCEIPTGRERGKSRVKSEDSDALSISIEFNSKNTHIEDNNTETAVDLFGNEIEDLEEEKETPTSLTSNPNQDESQIMVTKVGNHGDKDFAPPRYHNNILALKLYGIELNKQLEKIAEKYSEKEVERSLEYMEERIEAGKAITNKAGWLTDCLKDEWWRQSSKSLEEAAIAEGFSAYGKRLIYPDAFFDELWSMVAEGYIEETPPGYAAAPIGRYLQLKDGEIYVGWYDSDLDDSSTEFRVVHFTEMMRLVHE